MSDSALQNAINERKELQERIRLALIRLAEIEKFLKMHRQFALNSPSSEESSTGETLGRAGGGIAQPLFEVLVQQVLREVGRPLQSGEIVDEFQKRGHPIGGLNEAKQAWNRLWEAKTRNVLVHLGALGYWLSDEPIPENVPIPDGPRKRMVNPRRRVGGLRGRKPTLTPEVRERVREMLEAGKSVQQIADELGGLSKGSIYYYFPGGLSGVKNEEPDSG